MPVRHGPDVRSAGVPHPCIHAEKTTGPAVSAAGLGTLDAVLLSHHQHADNLDRSGRSLLATVPLVVSTRAAAEEIGPSVTPLASWEHVEVPSPDGRGCG